MPIDYAALRTELTTDPRGYGYNAAARNDSDMAARINLIRDGSAGTVPTNPTGDGGSANGVILIKRNDVVAAEIVVAIDLADIPALPTNPNNSQLSSERRSLAYLQMLSCMPGTVRLLNDDGSNTPVVSNVAGIFNAGSATLTRLNALRTRPGSRAEEKFGRNVAVTIDDIGKALN